MAGPRLSDLAARLGLNGSTVSRALRGDQRIRPETRRRVEAAAREIGYRPNLAARALAEGRTRTVWFVIPDMELPIDRAGAAPAAKRCLESGYDLLVAQHHRDPFVYARILERLASGGADGAILIPPANADGGAERSLLAKGIPLVYFDRHVEGIPMPLATTDNAGATAALFAALWEEAARGGRPYDLIVDGFGGAWTNTVEARRSAALREAARLVGVPLAGKTAGGGVPGGQEEGGRARGGRVCVFASARDRAVQIMDEVLAGGSLAADAGVFDEWGGGPEGFGRIAVAEQDFTAMGEAAADLLIGVLERDSGGECAVTAAVTAAGPTPARLVPFRGVRWISGAAGA